MENKPMVVDIKIKSSDQAICRSGDLNGENGSLATIAQCSHVRADGMRCGRRAAPGRDQCEWHGDWNFQLMPHSAMPYPEDAISIQQLLARTLAMMLSRHITPDQARAAAVLCKEMRANLARFEWEMRRYELVSGAEPGKARGPYMP